MMEKFFRFIYIVILIIIACYTALLGLFMLSFTDYLDSREFTMENKSDLAIYCFGSTSDSIKEGIINNENIKISDQYGSLQNYKIDTDSIVKISWMPSDWHYDHFYEKKESIRVFIITQDSVDRYGWDEIINRNIYTKKYLFNKRDLDKRDWKLTFEDHN